MIYLTENTPRTMGQKVGRLVALVIIFSFLLIGLAACSDGSSPIPTSQTGQVTTPSTLSTVNSTPDQNNNAISNAVTSTPVGKDPRLILHIWTSDWKGNSKIEDSFNTLMDNYRTLHPNYTFDWEDYGTDTYTKLSDALTSNNVPDLILIDAADLYNFASKGQLSNLETLGGTDLQSKYVQSAWDGLNWDSKSFGIPWLATGRVSLINRTLWQQAGLNPTDLPKTFDDLNKALPNLRDKTPKDATAVWLHPDPIADFMMEGVPLYQIGGDGKSKLAAFNTDVAQGRWDYYSQLRKAQYFADGALSGSDADALKLFGTNKLGVVLDGTNILSDLKSQYPTVYSNTLVTLYPLSVGKVLPMQLEGWAVPQNSQEKSVALDFAQYITGKDNELIFAKISPTYVPTLKAALSDPYLTQPDEPIAQARSIIAQNLGQMRPPEQFLPEPITPALRDKLLAALVIAQKAAWSKQLSSKDALSQAENTWNDLLK